MRPVWQCPRLGRFPPAVPFESYAYVVLMMDDTHQRWWDKRYRDRPPIFSSLVLLRQFVLLHPPVTGTVLDIKSGRKRRTCQGSERRICGT